MNEMFRCPQSELWPSCESHRAIGDVGVRSQSQVLRHEQVVEWTAQLLLGSKRNPKLSSWIGRKGFVRPIQGLDVLGSSTSFVRLAPRYGTAGKSIRQNTFGRTPRSFVRYEDENKCLEWELAGMTCLSFYNRNRSPSRHRCIRSQLWGKSCGITKVRGVFIIYIQVNSSRSLDFPTSWTQTVWPPVEQRQKPPNKPDVDHWFVIMIYTDCCADLTYVDPFQPLHLSLNCDVSRAFISCREFQSLEEYTSTHPISSTRLAVIDPQCVFSTLFVRVRSIALKEVAEIHLDQWSLQLHVLPDLQHAGGD